MSFKNLNLGGVGKGMLKYFMPIRTDAGDTYSIDKLILDFKLRAHGGGEWADDFFLFLQLDMEVYFKHWTTNKIGTFREQFSFQCDDGESFWCGVGLNDGSGKLKNRVRLEFNPNKVARSYVFVRVFNRLRVLAVGPPRVVRLDLAVDFPVLRSDAYLLKDARTYEEYSRSDSDRTQYLGERNSHGRCKLYNKAQESGLSHPLTRLEVTISGTAMGYEDILAVWPRVLVMDDLQMVFDGEKVTDVDRFIMRTLIQEPDRIRELSWYKAKKIRCTMERYTRFLKLDKPVYERIISQLYIYSQVLDNDYVLNPFSGIREEVTGFE